MHEYWKLRKRKKMPRKHVKKNLKKYTEVVFESAMETIKNGLSIRQAAKQFQVPHTTPCSHSGTQIIYEHAGRFTKFNKAEEYHLVQAVLAL